VSVRVCPCFLVPTLRVGTHSRTLRVPTQRRRASHPCAPTQSVGAREGRFAHLFKPGPGEAIIAELQAEVDRKWAELLEREAASKAKAAPATQAVRGT